MISHECLVIFRSFLVYAALALHLMFVCLATQTPHASVYQARRYQNVKSSPGQERAYRFTTSRYSSQCKFEIPLRTGSHISSTQAVYVTRTFNKTISAKALLYPDLATVLVGISPWHDQTHPNFKIKNVSRTMRETSTILMGRIATTANASNILPVPASIAYANPQRKADVHEVERCLRAQR